jgi:hypothetical protein
VEALLLATNELVWGSFDPVSGNVTLHNQTQPTAEELINFAVVETLKNRGVVYVLESDVQIGDAGVAALLRF